MTMWPNLGGWTPPFLCVRLDERIGQAIMAGHRPIEQHILKLRSCADIVNDHGPSGGAGAVRHNADMRQPASVAAQIPRNDVAGKIITGIVRDRKPRAFSGQEFFEIGDAPMIDIRIRP